MIFNFTEKYQFDTKLSIDGNPIEVIDSTRLLGTIITKDLRWDLNTAHIEQIAEHAEPLQVADIFCPDTEYNRAVLPSHHAIPQLDGLSAHGHVLPTPSSSSGQVFLSGLGLGRQERNIISEEQSRNREREQDLNMIKNLLGKF